MRARVSTNFAAADNPVSSVRRPLEGPAVFSPAGGAERMSELEAILAQSDGDDDDIAFLLGSSDEEAPEPVGRRALGCMRAHGHARARVVLGVHVPASRVGRAAVVLPRPG